MYHKKYEKEKKEFVKSCEFYCKYHKIGKVETVTICGNLEQVVGRLLREQKKHYEQKKL